MVSEDETYRIEYDNGDYDVVEIIEITSDDEVQVKSINGRNKGRVFAAETAHLQ